MDDLKLVIRPGQAADAEVMALIDERCFSLPWSLESFYRELTKNKIAIYTVAEDAGTVIGYMGLWRVENEGHITNIAVLPEYRGMHVASALLDEMIEKCARNGIVDYTLEVRAGNVPARCLYEKYGFRSEGVRPGYYEDDKEDALIMWRRGTTI